MKSLLNKTVQDDITNFKTNGLTPLSMLKSSSSAVDIVNRYQTMFANENLKLIVNDKKQPIIPNSNPFTEDNKFSLFALEKASNINNITYPLITPYKAKANYDCPAYQVLKDNFSKAFHLKVVEKKD